MTENEMLLLSGKIYKDRIKYDIILDENKSFKMTRFHYDFISDEGSFYNYKNMLLLKDGCPWVIDMSRNIDLPTYLKPFIKITFADEKFEPKLNNCTYEEITKAFIIAKKKVLALKDKNSIKSKEARLIKEMKKYSS